MPLRVYNVLQREKVDFVPLHEGKVNMSSADRPSTIIRISVTRNLTSLST